MTDRSSLDHLNARLPPGERRPAAVLLGPHEIRLALVDSNHH